MKWKYDLLPSLFILPSFSPPLERPILLLPPFYSLTSSLFLPPPLHFPSVHTFHPPPPQPRNETGGGVDEEGKPMVVSCAPIKSEIGSRTSQLSASSFLSTSASGRKGKEINPWRKSLLNRLSDTLERRKVTNLPSPPTSFSPENAAAVCRKKGRCTMKGHSLNPLSFLLPDRFLNPFPPLFFPCPKSLSLLHTTRGFRQRQSRHICLLQSIFQTM